MDNKYLCRHFWIVIVLILHLVSPVAANVPNLTAVIVGTVIGVLLIIAIIFAFIYIRISVNREYKENAYMESYKYDYKEMDSGGNVNQAYSPSTATPSAPPSATSSVPRNVGDSHDYSATINLSYQGPNGSRSGSRQPSQSRDAVDLSARGDVEPRPLNYDNDDYNPTYSNPMETRRTVDYSSALNPTYSDPNDRMPSGYPQWDSQA